MNSLNPYHMVYCNMPTWRYYVTFINDKSWLTTLYLLKTKDEVPWVYKQYEAWVETQMGLKIKVLNSD